VWSGQPRDDLDNWTANQGDDTEAHRALVSLRDDIRQLAVHGLTAIDA
jgi:hypothetical protein